MHLFSVPCGDMTARYDHDPTSGAVGLTLLPTAAAGRAARPDGAVEPLVQLSVTGDRSVDLWSQGATLRNRSTTRELALSAHRVERAADGVTVTVELAAPGGLRADHVLRWRGGEPCVEVETVAVNGTGRPLTLQLLSSFCLDGIPAAGAPAGTVVHRIRGGWSSEGRLTSQDLGELGLEGWPREALRVLRYGQLGTMPVRDHAPCVAVEDRAAGAVWGAALCWPGSWQIELYRRGGPLSVAGGLADGDFGHWRKTLAPGERFAAPRAWLTVNPLGGGAGSDASGRDAVDGCFRRLVAMQDARGPRDRAGEYELPAVANEFATTWGRPSHDRLVAMAERLAGTSVAYLVADAGWYAGGHGDWDRVKEDAFPGGLAATAKAVGEHGLALGLWVEAETCDENSTAFSCTEHLLHRDGVPVTAGRRRFWDLRRPRTAALLLDRIAELVDANGIGYLKIDYNEPLGAGCDGAESPGEGLRRQVAAALDFFAALRARLPGVVIENCASGGHRLDPASMSVSDLASGSDAMEGAHLPIVAADANRLVPGARSLVWVVPRAADTPRELVYKLAAGLLGRFCLSGDFLALDAAQWGLTAEALALYRLARPALASGRWRRHGPPTGGYGAPAGWQALVRTTADGTGALAVLHAFADPPTTPITVPLPPGAPFAPAAALHHGPPPTVEAATLRWHPPSPHSATAIWLRRPRPGPDARGPDGR
ncbi:glycoside hydrolase family 36 protein [Streptomyces sp. CA2R106]|uniref:glycoside hydrolase family 36 protein n=1 Tax=Streptomyces sp. CA2R106 TaxID=3120153 RepID=UPI003008EB0A